MATETLKFVKLTPYVICFGTRDEPGAINVEIVDVGANEDLLKVLVREVEVFLDNDDYLVNVSEKDFDDSEDKSGAWLTIATGPNGEKGPFGTPWLIVRIAKATRALQVEEWRQMKLQLEGRAA